MPLVKYRLAAQAVLNVTNRCQGRFLWRKTEGLRALGDFRRSAQSGIPSGGVERCCRSRSPGTSLFKRSSICKGIHNSDLVAITENGPHALIPLITFARGRTQRPIDRMVSPIPQWRWFAGPRPIGFRTRSGLGRMCCRRRMAVGLGPLRNPLASAESRTMPICERTRSAITGLFA